MKASRFEAIDWILFSIGGLAATFLIPAHIIATNIVSPLGLLGREVVAYDAIATKLANPLVKLYFLAVLGGAVLHAQHRIRFLLYDLGLVKYRRTINALIALLLVLSLAFVIFAVVFTP